MGTDSIRSRLSSRFWIGVAILAGLLILGDLNRRMSNARRLEQDAVRAATQVASLEADNARLATQIAAVTGDALVEEWARREVKMIRPGDHLVIPIAPPGPAGGTAATPTPPPPLPSPWEIWRVLLFGR
jgi:cell division protein FtsB